MTKPMPLKPTRITSTALLALLLSSAFPLPLSSPEAQARGTEEYIVVDEEEIANRDLRNSESEIEEVEVVSPRRVKRKIIRQRLAEDNAVVEAGMVSPTAKEETFGEKLSKKIDGRLEGNRRKHEEEMRRKQKEDEDRMLSKLDNALSDDIPASATATPAPAPQPVQPIQQQPLIQNQTIYSTVADPNMADEEEISSKSSSSKSARKNNFTISPTFGGSHISSSSYDVSNGTAVGLTLEVGVDENVVINGGYTYSQHDITIAQNSQYYNGFNNFYYNNYSYNNYLNNNLNKLEYNQNIFDVGMKYLFFDRTARFRPYLGAGGAYSKGYLNYPQQTLNSFAQNPANNFSTLEDYEVTNWSAYFQLGAVVNLSDSFGIGANYRYYKVLNSNENTSINNYGFINNGYGYTTANDKEFVGGSLKNSDFQTLGLSLNLTF